MALTLAITPTGKCMVVLLFTGVAAPIAGLLFRSVSRGWDSIGQGALAIDQDLALPRYMRSPERTIDPAIQAAEIRQMLEAKASRRQRRGEAPIDVADETARLLGQAPAPTSQDEKLRAEVRQLVVARNERRLRQGRQPLDVETETDRQLADFIGLGD